MRAVTEAGMATWLPSILACTALQRLQLCIDVDEDYSDDMGYLLGGCVNHFTGELRLTF
jgi:hypothetical protein